MIGYSPHPYPEIKETTAYCFEWYQNMNPDCLLFGIHFVSGIELLLRVTVIVLFIVIIYLIVHIREKK